jgi:hypothetical protein
VCRAVTACFVIFRWVRRHSFSLLANRCLRASRSLPLYLSLSLLLLYIFLANSSQRVLSTIPSDPAATLSH